MTEQEPAFRPEEHELTVRDAPADAEEPGPEGPATGDSPTSGVPVVEAALAEIEGVEALSLEEQLAAFERAHALLRSALDSEPGDPA